jgi:hypothetical protein
MAENTVFEILSSLNPFVVTGVRRKACAGEIGFVPSKAEMHIPLAATAI